MAPKTFTLPPLTGGINTLDELNNLVTFNNQGLGCEFVDCENYVPKNQAGMSRVTGFSLFYDTGSTQAINGLYRFLKSDGSSYFIYSQTTKVYKLASGTPTDIGITTSAAYLNYETAMDRLIICDALAKPFTYDGSATGSLTAAPAFAKASLFYQNRLWVISDQSPNSSYVYYSNPSDITTGYATQFVPCDINNGQKIVSISKFFIPGEIQPVILVCKERSKGMIVGDGSDANPYHYVAIDLDSGGVSNRTSIQFGQQIATLTPKGVSTYMPGSTNQSNLIYNYLSKKVRPSFLALSQTALNSSIAWHDWKNTRISFAVPEVANQVPNVIWHFDEQLGAWYKERWNLGQDCTASLIDANGDWYHGDSQGKIYLHDTNGSFNGQSITSFLTLPYLTFGESTTYKRCLVAKMSVRSATSSALGLAVKQNYGGNTAKSSTFTIQNSGLIWGGGGKWGSGLKWGSTPLRNLKFYPGGPFQSLQFKFTQTGINQKTDIFGLEFVVEPTGLF